MLQKIDPLEVPSRRFTNLVLYKLQEGLDHEGQLKLNVELESTARRIQHPLSTVKVEVPAIVKERTPNQPKVRERKPPPGWKSEKEAFNNAMALMHFTGKVGK